MSSPRTSFLTANGKSGYVDEHGAPNGSYRDGDTRIKAFAEVGAAVIEQYAAMAGPRPVIARRGV